MNDMQSNWWDAGFEIWLFWLILALVIVLIIRMLVRKASVQHGHDTALEILKIRYAEGEIDDAEYERRKKELED